jgi:hypothetical protein
LLNVDGFFTPLVDFLDRLVKTGFIHPKYRAMLAVAATSEELLARFAVYEPPADKWEASVTRT